MNKWDEKKEREMWVAPTRVGERGYNDYFTISDKNLLQQIALTSRDGGDMKAISEVLLALIDKIEILEKKIRNVDRRLG